MGLALPLRPRSAVYLTGILQSASRPCRTHDINLGNPKKSSQRWLLLAFYHVNFTDIGMFSHIVDIINFGIGFSIF